MHQLVSPCTIQVTSKIFKFGRNRSKARDPLDSGGANCFFARQSSVAFSKEDARRGREVTIDETNPNPNPNLNPNPDLALALALIRSSPRRSSATSSTAWTISS